MPSKVERGPSNEIVCSIADHITTNIPFTCYHLYGRNLQAKRHEHGFKDDDASGSLDGFIFIDVA